MLVQSASRLRTLLQDRTKVSRHPVHASAVSLQTKEVTVGPDQCKQAPCTYQSRFFYLWSGGPSFFYPLSGVVVIFCLLSRGARVFFATRFHLKCPKHLCLFYWCFKIFIPVHRRGVIGGRVKFSASHRWAPKIFEVDRARSLPPGRKLWDFPNFKIEEIRK